KSAALVVCRLFGVPALLHVHGGNLDQFYARIGPLQRWGVRWVVGSAVEILVLGDYWRNIVVERFGVPAARVTVLYNGAPRPQHPPVRAARSFCELLFLGMVWPEKGIGELLSALGAPALRALDWHMTIAGIGRIEEYRGQAQALDIAERVDFVGWTDEGATNALLEAADILVLPSHFECLPMVVIEAMAYGLAVIATPVGSVTEAVDDERNGLIVPVGDSERLGQAIRRLIEEPGLRRQLGANAYARFCATFDLDIFERRMREIYRKHVPVSRTF
ncbi:MAG: glycosyltransferase family 4 protein, partial [Stellaceae bacterium]